jgi:isopenicillin N synthase-like dioxygenase
MLLINFTPVQKILVDNATAYLSKKLNTAIHIDYISLSFLYQIKVEGLQIKDRTNNNLIQIGIANVNFNNWFITPRKFIF